MQVSATIIAAQQAAREARAALLTPRPQAAASFLSELKETVPAAEARPASAPPANTDAAPAPMRPGSLVNIVI